MNTKEFQSLYEIGEYKDFKDSNWHLLELISDGKDKSDCQFCHRSILCPTYKCKKDSCGFMFHKPCIEQPHFQDMDHEHNLWETNHMIFKEELGNEEKVACSFCGEAVSSFAYTCSIPSCNFLIHQSCIDLPLCLLENASHSHPLRLKGTLEDQLCDLCNEVCNRCFCYQCFPCKFSIHVKCASLYLIKVENCHPHRFVVMRKGLSQLTCEACGKQNDEILYLCKNCHLLIHWICVKRYQRNIKTTECSHSLTLTYSVHPREQKCRICEELVDKRYAAYICQVCDYVAHLWCASANLNSIESKIETIEEINNHFSHPKHKLILSNKQDKFGQHCMVCLDQIISPPFYNCARCEFFMHERCGKLSTKIKAFFADQGMLTLLPRTSSIVQACDGCQRTSFKFIYQYDKFDHKIYLDIQCALLQRDLKHEGHQHRLYFYHYDKITCNACNDGDIYYFKCTFCNFNLCVRCATYPLQTIHRDHEHILNLTYKIEDDSGEYYCYICEQKRNHNQWFYYCQECNFSAHLSCAYLRADP